MERVYFDQCHHMGVGDIEKEKCLKRYFDIRIPGKWETKRLIVCNEYIRLKYSNYEIENPFYLAHISPQFVYQQIIEEIINTVFPIEYPCCCEHFGTNANPSIYYEICERPHIIRCIKLYDGLKLLIDGNDLVTDDFWKEILYQTIGTCDLILSRSNINKTKQENLKRILRNLLKYRNIDQFRRKITELLIEFLEIQSTFKL